MGCCLQVRAGSKGRIAFLVFLQAKQEAHQRSSLPHFLHTLISSPLLASYCGTTATPAQPNKSNISPKMTRSKTTTPEQFQEEEESADSIQKWQRQEEERVLKIVYLNNVPESLDRYSLRACVFHFGQAAILFYFASKSETKWRWYTSYPEPEEDSLSHPPLGPLPDEIAYFSILWYSPIFISMAGLEHLCCLLLKDRYHYYVARNQNPFRWTEYTFSASLMRVMVAQFAGITDVHLLLVTFILSAITMQMGAAHETFNAKARSEDRYQNWRCYHLAWVSQGVSWMLIFNYFGMRVRSGSQPDFIWVIIIIMFLLE